MWTTELQIGGGFLGNLHSKLRRSARRIGSSKNYRDYHASEKVEWEFMCFPNTNRKCILDPEPRTLSPIANEPQASLKRRPETCSTLELNRPATTDSVPPPIPPRQDYQMLCFCNITFKFEHHHCRSNSSYLTPPIPPPRPPPIARNNLKPKQPIPEPRTQYSMIKNHSNVSSNAKSPNNELEKEFKRAPGSLRSSLSSSRLQQVQELRWIKEDVILERNNFEAKWKNSRIFKGELSILGEKFKLKTFS